MYYALFSFARRCVGRCVLPALLLVTQSGWAADLPLCSGPSFEPIPQVDAPDDNRTHLQADHANVSSDKVTTFTGSVVIQRSGSQLEADRADYTHSTDNIDAQGNIKLLTGGLLVTGSEAHMNLSASQGTVQDTTYRADKGRGTAKQLRLESETRLEMEQATYTTCDLDDPDWQLRADHITLNNENRQGSASHVVIEFKGVPFLYLPYMRFPIGDERMTGFLYPNIGASDKHGMQYIVPFYWNIAPHRDATITPWYMHKRGTMLQNEFRYLNPTNQGQFELDYLDDDREAAGLDRRRLRWQHAGAPLDGWSTSADYSVVGDNQHLVDFGDALNTTSQTYLDRKGSLAYNAEQWVFNALLQSHQTLSSGETYQRLPQLTFTTRLQQTDNSLNYHFESEWVNFVHRNQVLEGSRLHLRPGISLPLRNSAAFLVPRVDVHHTQYSLEPVTPIANETPSSSVPVFSLDSGLFFERDAGSNNSLLQTLEPRLLYAYIPYRDQDQLPVFDAADAGFSINDPFRINRFGGNDRVGDTNQVTAGLTTRLLDQESGTEYLSASIAQVFYFDERRVSLSGSTTTDNRSDIIAELTTNPTSRWYFHTDTVLDPDINKLTSANSQLKYNHDRFSVDLAYRYARNSLETNEAGFTWQISPRWHWTWRRLYDLDNHRKLESSANLRYESCCWAINLGNRERFIAEGEENEQTIMLLLELKGLASFGQQ